MENTIKNNPNLSSGTCKSRRVLEGAGTRLDYDLGGGGGVLLGAGTRIEYYLPPPPPPRSLQYQISNAPCSAM